MRGLERGGWGGEGVGRREREGGDCSLGSFRPV